MRCAFRASPSRLKLLEATLDELAFGEWANGTYRAYGGYGMTTANASEEQAALTFVAGSLAFADVRCLADRSSTACYALVCVRHASSA